MEAPSRSQPHLVFGAEITLTFRIPQEDDKVLRSGCGAVELNLRVPESLGSCGCNCLSPDLRLLSRCAEEVLEVLASLVTIPMPGERDCPRSPAGWNHLYTNSCLVERPVGYDAASYDRCNVRFTEGLVKGGTCLILGFYL